LSDIKPRAVVDLPEPDSPTIASTLPGCSSKFMLTAAGYQTPSTQKSTVKSLTSRIGLLMATTPFKDLAKTGGNPEFFRARGTYFYSGAGYIFCAGMGASIVVESGSLNFSQSASIALMLFVAALIYRFLNRDVVSLNTKYALTVETKHGIFSCWSAIGPSRYQHKAIHRGDLGRVAEKANSIRATDSPHTDSGAAFYIANDRMNKRSGAESTRVTYVMDKHVVARVLHTLCLLAIVVNVIHN